ncbi:flagellar protein FlaG [Paraglaciecola hydrolytica]|uniref:flagellar protein FlaG n=1 Tax=Paraglaciecola hydrolytica TaxID=1799789 RepID=UPI0009E98F6A|nr:flagellar protein FlaG [Paraglaciecola hydrolytica]
MEINFSQSGRILADRHVAEAGPTQPGSVQSIVAKTGEASSGHSIGENLSSTALAERQQNTKDISKSAEKEVSTERVLSSQEISAAVEGLSDFAKNTNRQLNFSIDEGTDKQVVKVTDAESGEIIRQIPSEEILRLSERLRELQSDLGATVGILFNKQV